ncbi:hypothetical protein AB0C77_16030 [Streptomyces sp. NPDC048629]|uniref:hypothetical protein n=1 Tax=Streptomyces sp. NPDC048629 TaxID=3154824 RepID=UPI003446998B
MFEPLPDSGKVAVEARFTGFDEEDLNRSMFDIQLTHKGRLCVTMRPVDVLLPQGPFGAAGRRREVLVESSAARVTVRCRSTGPWERSPQEKGPVLS